MLLRFGIDVIDNGIIGGVIDMSMTVEKGD
jgi:hypothetical protein